VEKFADLRYKDIVVFKLLSEGFKVTLLKNTTSSDPFMFVDAMER
jgi:hypothetical protein